MSARPEPPSPALLAIETSCDETAAAVVRRDGTVVGSVVASQAAAHAPHGGVVPELAARMHLERLAAVVDEALAATPQGWAGLDGVAVTRGPGLVGCLLVGTAYAQAAAAARRLPIVGVSHMLGHVWAARIARPDLDPPFVALVVSGGHTDLVHVRSAAEADLLGATRDDAVGEAFDKVARLLGLPYPGGPSIDQAAEGGDPDRFRLPRPLLPDFGFSFSGLKTAVRVLLEREKVAGPFDLETGPLRSDIAAGFQAAAVDTLLTQLEAAIEHTGASRAVVVGGVASNRLLRREAQRRCAGLAEVVIPAPRYCTDNAAMIGVAGWLAVAHRGFDHGPLIVDPGLASYRP